MNVEEYIASGILELYLAGQLSELEVVDVQQQMKEHAAVETEVLAIERTLMELTAALSPIDTVSLADSLKVKLNENETNPPSASIYRLYGSRLIGIAAMLLVIFSIYFWKDSQNQELNSELDLLIQQNDSLILEINRTNTALSDNQRLLSILRDENILAILLAGQGDYEATFAKVYWDQENQLVYVDAQNLPEPPEGMAYQLWSLTLDPLTPSSLGMISEFQADEDKVFVLENVLESEAFGITLEVESGVDSPTMERLYTLGVVEG